MEVQGSLWHGNAVSDSLSTFIFSVRIKRGGSFCKMLSSWWMDGWMDGWIELLTLKSPLETFQSLLAQLTNYFTHKECPWPCPTKAIWSCRNPFSQWQRSFQRKLHSHSLKFLRQDHGAAVKQGMSHHHISRAAINKAMLWLDNSYSRLVVAIHKVIDSKPDLV